MTGKMTESRKAYIKKWQQDNRQRLNEYQQQWREDHPDRVKAYKDRYILKKAEQIRHQQAEG